MVFRSHNEEVGILKKRKGGAAARVRGRSRGDAGPAAAIGGEAGENYSGRQLFTARGQMIKITPSLV